MMTYFYSPQRSQTKNCFVHAVKAAQPFSVLFMIAWLVSVQKGSGCLLMIIGMTAQGRPAFLAGKSET